MIVSKTYRHRNLSCVVTDTEKVIFRIENVSDGNEGVTNIVLPMGKSLLFENNIESVDLGKGSELRGEESTIYVRIDNAEEREDEIRVRFWINETLIIEHYNSKIEEENPLIILYLKFLSS